jgi:hypothetical protein
MKKPYIKPTVSIIRPIRKIEIDGDAIRMLTKQGFTDLFFEILQEAKKKDEMVTHEQVFNFLNERYIESIGCPRYTSYDAFRRRKDS